MPATPLVEGAQFCIESHRVQWMLRGCLILGDVSEMEMHNIISSEDLSVKHAYFT